jgi:hypothetical protein
MAIRILRYFCRRLAPSTLLLLALLLLACTPEPAPRNDATTTPEPTPLPVATTAPNATATAPPPTATQPPAATPTTEETMTPQPSPPPGTNRFVDQAVADLARRLGVPPTAIELQSFQAVVWPDGSLGCPEPGMEYIQVLVEGYRILLRHGGETYAYHGGGARDPFLCDQPGAALTPPPGYDDI